MTEPGRETEAKFLVLGLSRVERRLRDLGAVLVQPRVFERNVRLDLPGSPLRAEGRVLRLRDDNAARLTYKGPGTSDQGVLSRVEIEFEVGSYEKALRLLEALGYRKLVYYEKYRAIQELQGAQVMLDELPYGDFVEIEGDSTDVIRRVSDSLGFRWDNVIETSYHALFDRMKESLGVALDDLSFDALRSLNVDSGHLGVRPADQ